MHILSTVLPIMSDLVAEPPDVTNLGSPRPLEGVSDGAHSCLDSDKSGADLPQSLSATSPASECVKSEEDIVESHQTQSVATSDCSVSEGAI